MGMVRWVMGGEPVGTPEILEEARAVPIAMVMRRRRLEWFGHVKRRDETENIRAVVAMQMEDKRPGGRPRLQWKDTARRDLKAWNIREEWPLPVREGKVSLSAGLATPLREMATKGERSIHHKLSVK